MGAFEYQALEDGRSTRGVIQADTARQARQQLRERGLIPLDVSPVEAARGARQGRGLARERALLFRQLSTLLRAGLPLEEAIAVLAEQAERPALRRSLAGIRARIVEGRNLSEALAETPALTPEMYVRAVAAGERAGSLEAVLGRLADHAERQEEISRRLVVAMAYPVILTFIALLVVWGLIGFVVPRVVGVFDQAVRELPAITRSLLALADFTVTVGPWLLVLLLLLTAAFAWLYRQPAARLAADRLALKIPLFGRLERARQSARFARTLGILTGSAVPLVEALGASAAAIGNHAVRLDLQNTAARVREGQSLSRSLEGIDWLPPMTRRLIAAGERSGELPSMLDHAADLQERDLEAVTGILLAVLQPVLILAVGLFVMYIVLAILLPILDMSRLLA